jgi:ligand-binding sensor domain-containing protein
MKEALRDKRIRIAAALLFLLGLSTFATFLYQISRARKALIEVRTKAAEQNLIPVDSRNFSLAPDPQAQLLSQPYEIRKVLSFHDIIYAATSNGLVTYTEEGKQIEHWSSLEGLPSQDLTTLAVFNDSLWIGTSDSGLIRFKDQHWTHFLPQKTEYRFIHTLLATSQGKILAGTDAGILSYDGQRFLNFAPALNSEKITALSGDAQSLFIGTFANGLYRYEAGVMSHFGREEGLRDLLVTDVQTIGQLCYVSSADGLQVLENKSFRTIANQLFVTSFIVDTPNLWAATRDSGVIRVVPRTSRPPIVESWTSRSQRTSADGTSALYVAKLDSSIIAFSGSEISILQNNQWKIWSSPKPLFSDANVSSLLKAKNGELWIGYFDHGLDILSASKNTITHYKDDNLFCVNHISEDSRERVYVSTSNGLVIFQPNRTRKVYRVADGLLSDRVMQTLPLDPDGKKVAIATAQGFTLKEGESMKSIFAFHGLVNNHVYTMAAQGQQIFLGTLGGISHVSHMQITENWTQMDSGLKRNWVNAMVSIDNQLFVGTYGSGIQVKTDSGQWLDFPALPEDLEINPNALYYYGSLLFCGTLDRGIYIYNTQIKSWKHVSQGLPSLNVTSFATDGDSIYIGTDRGLLQMKYDKISTFPDLI